MTTFPKNPADKTIFEASSGEFYQFDACRNTWVHLQGYGILLDEATSLRDGLMASTDLKKINSLILPPPNTSLTAEGCSHVFNSGVFGFRSGNEDILIDTSLKLMTKDSEGNPVETDQVWKIHENTYGINFRINLPQLVDNLVSKGKLTYHKTVGPQGKKGLPGDDGINKLETGPQGPVGNDGKNMSFLGSLLLEGTNVVLANQSNRAIVDIYTESQQDGNYLIITRANIGDVNQCPSLVNPRNIKSKWILAADERPAEIRVLESCNPTCQSSLKQAGCGNSSRFTQTQVVQNFCSTRLYYIDMSAIEEEIRNRYLDLLEEMRLAKQTVVEQWMNVMIGVYNDQKNSICCAIENCESKRENQKNRQYIEQMRMAGAAAHVSTVFSCSVDDRQYKTFDNPDSPRDCPPGTTDPTARDMDGNQPFIARLEIDCSANSPTEEQAVSINLEPGIYRIEAASCACYSSEVLPEADYLVALKDPSTLNPKILPQFKAQKPYTGVFTIVYQSARGPVKIISPNLGSFRKLDEATKIYAGNKVIVNHTGGPLKAFFAGGSFKTKEFGNSGKMQLFISKQQGIGIARSQHRDCAVPLLELDLDCGLNFEEENAIVAELAAGSYVAEVEDCCCQIATPVKGGISSGYSGVISLKFMGKSGEQIMSNPNLGTFKDQITAVQRYVGSSFGFTHMGGQIKVWSTVQGVNGGSMRIAIRHKDCFENLSMPSVGSGFGPGVKEVITRPKAHAAEFTTCYMSLSQLMFYEGGWISKACCGALIEVGGVRWLVVKRSVGVDMTCGGGESELSDCIQKSAPFGFHPAVAFQTLDDQSFFGKPTSGLQMMYRDHELERMILEKIESNEMLAKVGDPASNISAILFPFEGHQ
jgi:hypothetical protein